MIEPMTAPTPLRQHWQALAPREQNLVLTAGALVLLALLWWLAIAPALATLRTAPARHAALDNQLQHMLRLQAEAQQLQAAPRNSPGDTVAALRTALTQHLGKTAQINLLGDRATVTLQGACADALAQWLTQTRSNARASTLEARLTRSAAPAAIPPGVRHLAAPAPPTPCSPAMPRWDGSLVLVLPDAAR